MKSFRLFLLLLLPALAGMQCGITLDADSSSLNMKDGRLMHEGIPFSGTLRQKVTASGETRLTEYKNGREEGKFTAYDREGNLMEERFFSDGIKTGIHRGWHANGEYRYYYEFSAGRYVGEAWQWYADGKPYQFQKYDDRGNLLASKMWRPDGSIYENRVYSAAASAGMPGSKLCNPVRKNS